MGERILSKQDTTSESLVRRDNSFRRTGKPGRKIQKPKLAVGRPDFPSGLHAALSRCTKAELVEVLLELARSNCSVSRRLSERFVPPVTVENLVPTTRQDIAAATAFDPRDMNRNFDYDMKAYRHVHRNLKRLIDAGELRVAMTLSLELMQAGSRQVEMSDEGLMTTDIEDCLSVVFQKLMNCDLPETEILARCSALHKHDRVGFIAEKLLLSLQNRIRESAL